MVDIETHRISRLSSDFFHLWESCRTLKGDLYVKGRPEALSLLKEIPSRAIAIVGTRQPQPRSVFALKSWLGSLKNTNLVVISGFARGIDSTAHQEALNAGLKTIGILAGGFNHLYPPEHKCLADQILESGGLLVSEFAPNIPCRPYQFASRNRLIAAFSQATWVVEAPLSSGALITAREAHRLEKPVLATTSFPTDEAFAGNLWLIENRFAEPFLGLFSLGQIWIELSAQFGGPRKTQKSKRRGAQLHHYTQFSQPELAELTHEVASQMQIQKGATLESLFDWAAAKKWPSERFFEILGQGISCGRIIDENGLFLINPESVP